MPRMIIDGQEVDSALGELLDVQAPADGLNFSTIPRGRQEDVDRAVRAARRALAGPWGRLPPHERGRLLLRLSQRVLDSLDELAALEARDAGKPISTGRNDIVALARYLEFYGGAADKVHGDVIPFLCDHNAFMLREPLGVTAHIIPWNYPAQIFGRSIGAALAMGNAAVVKPAEDACLSTLRVAQMALECGLPPGVLNVVTGLGEEAGAALASHPDIDFVTFTGSGEVGCRVQAAAAANVVPCSLELGGKSAQIVFDEADVERAAPIIVRAILQNTGQTCTAGSRLLVQNGIHDELMRRVAQLYARTRAGTPEMDLDCGPVINRTQRGRIEAMVAQARDAGIAVLAEGEIATGVPTTGHWVRPVLFGDVPPDAPLAQQEVFGPVLAAMRFADEAQALQLANGTPYGLLAAVWTRDGGRQMRMARALRVGQVFINCYGAGGGIELPFGGVRRSGHGREKGMLALEQMSSPKTVVQYHG